MLVIHFATIMMMDLLVAIMQVNISVAVMQLEVSAAFRQVKVSTTKYVGDNFYCNYARGSLY